MGVDRGSYGPFSGRKSVRVTSPKAFNRGLIVADISHMPSGACGVWPAFWMFGPDWPSSGEIDIIEGVNYQETNIVTLHTSPGCSVTLSGSGSYFSALRKDCSIAGAGCGMQPTDCQTYGDGFNNINGGVYAMEWTSESISVWFFPRHDIPMDVTSRLPEPRTWGDPLAKFQGGDGCNIDSHFSNNQIVFDITFCSDWAGSPLVWSSNPRCSASGLSCHAYVANNPTDYTDAYWLVNSVNVYKKRGDVEPEHSVLPSSVAFGPQP
ncbi:glycoside hydrolase family 16 protein [Metarhizium robertsii ARSEF 23]|uniref:Glycoside hydrolase family 16 protein n=1 Tax=Metarhizium robertsii (strain ARSEF 23 / ATCC MYA-3075) TaxID=655844 RepID=E9EK31_METRA|nr:glycoside hydrolase family 16 protein [Metarhizium robertsii ARSEF 23]EFZ03042.1 glycoside hydrolase family 16 protein [Metarhizium robertsii ARSEF 23]